MGDDREQTKRRDQADLIALVKEIVRYWRELASNRFDANPPSNGRSFEEYWPVLLDNFILAETTRASKRLRILSEHREN